MKIPRASGAAGSGMTGGVDFGSNAEPDARPPPDGVHAGGSRIRQDRLPRFLRNLLPRGGKSRKGKEVDTSAEGASPHLREAMQRTERLFAPKTPQDKRAAQARATRNVESYLAGNRCEPVDPRVKALLVLCDETIDDVQTSAIPFGRPNVFVTNWDRVAGRSLRNPSGLNADEILARGYLSKIRREIDDAAAADGIEENTRLAAASLYTGCAPCAGYASVFALALQQRCAELRLSEHETMRIDVVARPHLDGAAIDHECCVVTYTRDNGRDPKVEASVICDPWAQMNTPILAQHSRLAKWVVRDSLDPKACDAAATRGAIDSYLGKADQLCAAARHGDALRLRLSCLRYSLECFDSEKPYPIDDSFFGISRRQRLDFARPGVKLPRTRRPTHQPARQSGLVRFAQADPKSRDPRAVAHAMLECPDSSSWFGRWLAGLDLPREAQALRALLDYRFEDGASALGKAIEFGRADVLKSAEGVLKRNDRGGIGLAQWREALLGRRDDGEPALVRMLETLQRPGAHLEGMAAEAVRRYGKLLRALPEMERHEVLRAIFEAPGLPAVLRKGLDLPCLDALIDLLPAYEPDPDIKPRRQAPAQAPFDSRYRAALEQLRAERTGTL